MLNGESLMICVGFSRIVPFLFDLVVG